MNLLIFLVATPPLMLAVAFVVSCYLTLLQVWEEWDEKRAKKKQYDKNIKLWELLAAEELDPIEKGYKTARLCNYAYENRNVKGIKP